MALFNFWIVYTTLFSKKNISQKMICPHSRVKGWQSTPNRKSSLIDREANEAYASRPLTCMDPFQGPGRGSSKALEMPWNLTAHICTKLGRGFFSKFDKNYKNLHYITQNELRSWKKLNLTISSKKTDFDQWC